MQRLALVLAVASAPPAAAAGDVFVVDASGAVGQPSLFLAVLQADPGDVILLKDGTYSSPGIPAGVPVVGDVGATPVVTGPVEVHATAPNQWVALQNVSVLAPPPTFGAPAHAFRATFAQGPVLLERCVFAGAPGGGDFGGDGVRAVGAVSVVLSSCELLGGESQLTGGVGLDLDAGATVHAWSTAVTGGGPQLQLGSVNAAGGEGAVLQGSFLFATATSIIGGDGMPGAFVGAGCGPGGDGGLGLALLSGSTGIGLELSVAGGRGGAGCTGFWDGVDGPALLGAAALSTLPGSARGFGTNSPVRAGQPLEFTFEGAPGELAFLAYADAPSPAVFVPELAGSLAISPAGVLPFGPLPASGAKTVALPAPSVAPEQGVVVFAQAAFADPGTGAVRLGPPAMVVVLDPNVP